MHPCFSIMVPHCGSTHGNVGNLFRSRLREDTHFFKKELGNLGFNIGGKTTPASETPSRR